MTRRRRPFWRRRFLGGPPRGRPYRGRGGRGGGRPQDDMYQMDGGYQVYTYILVYS